MEQQLLPEEIRRMQKLAGIVTEINPPTPPNFPNSSLNNTINTGDETRLNNIVNKLPILITALNNINQPIELDGLFKIILTATSLEDTPKNIIIGALNKALRELEPNSQKITTKKEK